MIYWFFRIVSVGGGVAHPPRLLRPCNHNGKFWEGFQEKNQIQVF